MADLTKDQLKQKISDMKKVLDNPKASDATKAAIKTALEKAEKQLEELEKKAPAEAGEGKKKRVRRTKEQLAADKVAGKDKPKAKTEKKEQAEGKIEHFIQVLKDGQTVEFDLNDFDQACKAYEARKERDRQTSKKSKSKLPGEKAKTHVENTISSLEQMIPDDLTDAEGKKAITALSKFEEYQEKSFEALTSVIGEANVKRLKSALKGVHEVIADIKKELAKSKK